MNILHILNEISGLDPEKIDQYLDTLADRIADKVVEKIGGELEELLSVRAEFKIGDQYDLSGKDIHE